jgi:hypothetical protein
VRGIPRCSRCDPAGGARAGRGARRDPRGEAPARPRRGCRPVSRRSPARGPVQGRALRC